MGNRLTRRRRPQQQLIPEEEAKVLRDIGLEIKTRLGSGLSGNVYLAETCKKMPDINQNLLKQQYAVKCIDVSTITDTTLFPNQQQTIPMLMNIEREKRVMTLVKHRNVVIMKMCVNIDKRWIDSNDKNSDDFYYFAKTYIIMDFAQRGDLKAFLQTNRLSEPFAKRLCREMTDGLDYLHKQDIIHGDIHEANVMLFTDESNDQLIPKWADFGMSRLIVEVNHNQHEFIFDVIDFVKLISNVLERIELNSAEIDAFGTRLLKMKTTEQILTDQWIKSE